MKTSQRCVTPLNEQEVLWMKEENRNVITSLFPKTFDIPISRLKSLLPAATHKSQINSVKCAKQVCLSKCDNLLIYCAVGTMSVLLLFRSDYEKSNMRDFYSSSRFSKPTRKCVDLAKCDERGRGGGGASSRELL